MSEKKLYSVLKPVTHRLTGKTIMPGGDIDLSHVENPADLAWMFEGGWIDDPDAITQPVDDAADDLPENNDDTPIVMPDWYDGEDKGKEA